MFKVVSGLLHDVPLTLYAAMRNERFFLPAFFDHYRKCGILQFLVIDDRSDDGTRAYLFEQPDCVVVEATMRFGDKIGKQRAGTIWKTTLPQTYLSERWGLYVDADEFIVPPPDVTGFGGLVQKLESAQHSAVGAVMIDFYPASISDLADQSPPSTINELVDRYPYFDACPYIDWKKNNLKPNTKYKGVLERQMTKYGMDIRQFDQSISWKDALLSKLSVLGLVQQKRSVFKVPLVKWTKDTAYLNSHTLNRAPMYGALLPMMHFKLTAALYGKINWAKESGSYAKGSRAYFAYEELLRAMSNGDRSFLCPSSCRYRRYEDFLSCGLARNDF